MFFTDRGNAHHGKGDVERAVADFNEAIKLDAKADWAYLYRGIANLYSGSAPKALADVNQAAELDAKDAINALWVDIVGSRNGLPSRLSQATSQVDMTKWPGPVLRLFLGQLTPAAVLAAADDPVSWRKARQTCQANFYGGILALRKNANDEAARLFQAAASDCPKSLLEWRAATAELKALGK